MVHLSNDLWDYIEDEVAPMMRKLKLYEEESEETTKSDLPNLKSSTTLLDVFAEELLKCISSVKLNKQEVKTYVYMNMDTGEGL